MPPSHHVIRTFPIAARIAKSGAKQALAADRARIEKFKTLHTPHGPNRSENVIKKHVKAKKPFANADTPSIDVTDAGVTYTMAVEIGAGTYTLLFVAFPI